MQRQSSTRARQNSSHVGVAANRPSSSTTHHQSNGIGLHNSVDADKTFAAKSSSDLKGPKGDDNGNADNESRTSGRTNDRTLRRENSSTSRHRPPSISTSTRNNGRASKNGTPVTASFPENARPRSGRNTNATHPPFELPIKRSHKKGAGIQAQLAAAQAAAQAAAKATRDDDGSSVQGDEDEDLEGEPRYCYCNSVSYGEMVACDMAGCEREWFHLDCAGLTKPPGAKSMSLFPLQEIAMLTSDSRQVVLQRLQEEAPLGPFGRGNLSFCVRQMIPTFALRSGDAVCDISWAAAVVTTF